MTKKEYYYRIIELAKTTKDSDIIDFCNKEIAQLEKKNQNKQTANDELREQVYAALTDEFITRTQLATILNESVAKVGYRLNMLVDEGLAVKEEIVVEKNKKQMGYKLS